VYLLSKSQDFDMQKILRLLQAGETKFNVMNYEVNSIYSFKDSRYFAD